MLPGLQWMAGQSWLDILQTRTTLKGNHSRAEL